MRRCRRRCLRRSFSSFSSCCRRSLSLSTRSRLLLYPSLTARDALSRLSRAYAAPPSRACSSRMRSSSSLSYGSAGAVAAAVTAIRHPARARSQLYDSTHDGLARAVEPVALQVRCIHCHRRRCNCADCATDACATAPLLWALRWLWFGCKPLEQCQGGLALRLGEAQERLPPL